MALLHGLGEFSLQLAIFTFDDTSDTSDTSEMMKGWIL